MNQQFDLQNITDAVLKAVKSTGQEENVSAENIAKQVAEILKNNNTKINTFDSFDTDSLNNEKKFVEEEPKPLSGSFTLEEPPKTVEEVDTRDIDVPLNGSFGIKIKDINKIEKPTSKTEESTTSFSDNVKIDADDNKILEAAKKIIIDYIATEEFANKLKEILK